MKGFTLKNRFGFFLFFLMCEVSLKRGERRHLKKKKKSSHTQSVRLWLQGSVQRRSAVRGAEILPSFFLLVTPNILRVFNNCFFAGHVTASTQCVLERCRIITPTPFLSIWPNVQGLDFKQSPVAFSPHYLQHIHRFKKKKKTQNIFFLFAFPASHESPHPKKITPPPFLFPPH